MAKPRKPLKIPRSKAFIRQQGRCFYCHQPMWKDNPEHFAQRYGLTPKQTRLLQCTGEHLVEHAMGGKADHTNIVAACLFCNRRRHQRPKPLAPAAYGALVSKRMKSGKWHPAKAVSKKVGKRAQG